MEEQSLNARTKVADVKLALGFTHDQEWANFTYYARKVNLQMCKSYPAGWGNVDREWRSLPSNEQQTAITLMKQRSKHLFKGDLTETKIQSAIEGRLYSARRGWAMHARRLEGRKTHDINTTGVGVGVPSQPQSEEEEKSTDRRRVMSIAAILH